MMRKNYGFNINVRVVQAICFTLVSVAIESWSLGNVTSARMFTTLNV